MHSTSNVQKKNQNDLQFTTKIYSKSTVKKKLKGPTIWKEWSGSHDSRILGFVILPFK